MLFWTDRVFKRKKKNYKRASYSFPQKLYLGPNIF